jgi:hypothetical protein
MDSGFRRNDGEKDNYETVNILAQRANITEEDAIEYLREFMTPSRNGCRNVVPGSRMAAPRQ